MTLFVHYMSDFRLNTLVCTCACLSSACDFVYISVFNEVYMWCVCTLIHCNLVICDIHYKLIHESLNGKSKKNNNIFFQIDYTDHLIISISLDYELPIKAVRNKPVILVWFIKKAHLLVFYGIFLFLFTAPHCPYLNVNVYASIVIINQR